MFFTISYFKKLFNSLLNMPAHGILLRNAVAGWQNSQYELAKFYLVEKNDYVEAYAWADVACFNNHKDAPELKKIAEERLTTDQIKMAWDKAREYRSCFINN